MNKQEATARRDAAGRRAARNEHVAQSPRPSPLFGDGAPTFQSHRHKNSQTIEIIPYIGRDCEGISGGFGAEM